MPYTPRNERAANVALAAPIESRAALAAQFAAIRPAPVRAARQRAQSAGFAIWVAACVALLAVNLLTIL